MKNLTNEQLKETKGGISVGLCLGLTALAVFVVGIIDGIVRPMKCN